MNLKQIWQAILYIMIGLLAAGIIWLASSLPRGEPITLLPSPTPAPILVHLIGEIKNPGVYELPKNAHVLDAIQAAGGLTSNADDQAINLAALLEDGQQLLIPAKLPAQGSGNSQEGGDQNERSPASIDPLININSASTELLETLPGIGPVLAKAIVDYRQAEGEFKSIEEIQKVPGIGPEKYENIKDLITVVLP